MQYQGCWLKHGAILKWQKMKILTTLDLLASPEVNIMKLQVYMHKSPLQSGLLWCFKCIELCPCWFRKGDWVDCGRKGDLGFQSQECNVTVLGIYVVALVSQYWFNLVVCCIGLSSNGVVMLSQTDRDYVLGSKNIWCPCTWWKGVAKKHTKLTRLCAFFRMNAERGSS